MRFQIRQYPNARFNAADDTCYLGEQSSIVDELEPGSPYRGGRHVSHRTD
jgi:hypothetical protein